MSNEFYKIKDVYKDTSVLVSYKDKEIEFPIEILINRRSRDSYDKGMFTVLNKYVDWKGVGFKEKLFNRNVEVYNNILELTNYDHITAEDYKVVGPILDMFNFQEVKDFIKKYNIVTPLSHLDDEFNLSIEINKEGSRVQTYLKEDYIELVALLTIIKSVIGPIGMYAEFNTGKIPENYRELILINFLLEHEISETPPFKKLIGYIEKLVKNIETNEEELNIRLIKRGIDKENLIYSILGGVLFTKLCLRNEINDTEDKSIINTLYSYVSNKLEIKNTATSNIRIKKYYISSQDGEDTESIIESYRIPTELTQGWIEEFKFATSDIRRMYRFYTGKEPSEELKMFEHAIHSISPKEIPEVNIKLAFIILKKIIDPRAYLYVDAKNIKNVLTVAATVAWELDFQNMSLVLSSQKAPGGIGFSINSKTKLDSITKELLAKEFPLNVYNFNKRKNIITKVDNVVEKYITKIAEKMLTTQYLCMLPENIIEEVTGSRKRIIEVPTSIRSILTELLIKIEYTVN